MPREIALEELDFGAVVRPGDHIVWGTAPPVIAEVNDQLPWTFCEPPVDIDRIDLIVRTSRRPAQLAAEAIGPLEKQIAQHAGRYIDDGAVIQIGIGAIPDAVLAGLADR